MPERFTLTRYPNGRLTVGVPNPRKLPAGTEFIEVEPRSFNDGLRAALNAQAELLLDTIEQEAGTDARQLAEHRLGTMGAAYEVEGFKEVAARASQAELLLRKIADHPDRNLHESVEEICGWAADFLDGARA